MPHIIIVEPVVTRTGWNITDDLPCLDMSRELIRSYIINIQETVEETEEIKKKEETKKVHETIEDMEYPFQLLGYNRGYMYFLPGETGQIMKIKQARACQKIFHTLCQSGNT